MPRLVEPMMAVPGELPVGSGAAMWVYELKWDGVRAIAYLDQGVRATGRRGNDIAPRYPELAELAEPLAGHHAVLDGEITAFDERGRPSFEVLQRRMHVTDERAVRRLMSAVPVVYVVFDVLYIDGTLLFRHPYEERRGRLEELAIDARSVQVPPNFREDPAQLLSATAEQGLEGLVAKRLDSRYTPGRRSDAWRKIKNLTSIDVVVGGWKPGKGRRGGGIGSLLIGVYDDTGLRFIGHVGTGFTERALEELAGLLRPLEVPTSPYADEVPRDIARDVHWVRPRLVGEVAYTSWTREGRLRAPTWRGLRNDMEPEDARLPAGTVP